MVVPGGLGKICQRDLPHEAAKSCRVDQPGRQLSPSAGVRRQVRQILSHLPGGFFFREKRSHFIWAC